MVVDVFVLQIMIVTEGLSDPIQARYGRFPDYIHD